MRKKYALVMVDDYSRYTWVKFMHSKDETPHIIIEHIKKIEKQDEDQEYVKRLRSDNDTEFRNVTLTEFYKDKGIVQEFSAARTPHDSEDEAEVNTNHKMDEESTEQVNHENGSSSQPPEFDSTNSRGEGGESSASHANDEENAENSIEPKKTEEDLLDPDWISAMQEELNQRNKVWELVPVPKNSSVIGTKWVFRNKMDENGIVTRNKARLVAKGYSQEEGID
ncbi:hypothetical protein AgCh_029100 [Apium graveolens]